MALRDVKNKIRSVGKTGKVTKAMEAVSAVKMRKSQERAIDGRPYALSSLTILKKVVGSLEGIQHPLSENRHVKRVGIVVITSDKGLAGALNGSVLKEAAYLIEQLGVNKEDISILAVGRKACDYFLKREYEIIGKYTNVGDNISESDVRDITTKLTGYFEEKKIDAAYIVYPKFRSTFEQDSISKAILPLSFASLASTVRDIIPDRGKFSEIKEEDKPKVSTYTIEPSPEAVLSELIIRLINVGVYHSVLEAKASEHSARMIAMKKATDKAKELEQDLSRAYNKERQALITREVSEIIGGIESMQTT